MLRELADALDCGYSDTFRVEIKTAGFPCGEFMVKSSHLSGRFKAIEVEIYVGNSPLKRGLVDNGDFKKIVYHIPQNKKEDASL
jgi:hypothetical protein